MEYIAWDHNDLGISFAASAGRITIFKTTLTALEYPPFFRFLLDTENKQFGIERCEFESSGSHQLPEEMPQERYDIKSKDMVKFIYRICGWDTSSTYRIKGIAIPDQHMVVFDLTAALRVTEKGLIE